MPRRRFAQLSHAKRSRILEAAAKEFAAHGFEGASLNRILDQAEISKGAAYYYFDGKQDLYITTLGHFLQECWAALSIDVDQFTAGDFWPHVAALYRQLFLYYHERPWVPGIAKAGGPGAVDALIQGPMADMFEAAQGLLIQVVERGRVLGVIRDDVPDDLIQAWAMGLDAAHDRWLAAHRAEMSPADAQEAADQMADALRRLLSPQCDAQDTKVPRREDHPCGF